MFYSSFKDDSKREERNEDMDDDSSSPKKLESPEYLIVSDPTFVNVSDKIRVDILDSDKEPIEGTVMKIRDGELTAVFELD